MHTVRVVDGDLESDVMPCINPCKLRQGSIAFTVLINSLYHRDACLSRLLKLIGSDCEKFALFLDLIFNQYNVIFTQIISDTGLGQCVKLNIYLSAFCSIFLFYIKNDDRDHSNYPDYYDDPCPEARNQTGSAPIRPPFLLTLNAAHWSY